MSVHIPSANSTTGVSNPLIVGLPANIEAARKYMLKIVDNIEQGRRKAIEVNKEWLQGDPVNLTNGPESAAISSESAAAAANSENIPEIATSANANNPTKEVWFEDLLLNAKRIPATKQQSAPSTSSAAPATTAVPSASSSSAVPPAAAPVVVAAPASAESDTTWTSSLLTSNDGW